MMSEIKGEDTGKSVRSERAHATRELILTAAERLFAEHGVYAVSNRQVGEEARQGNNTVVSYHFGTKADLVRAIARRHSARIEKLRQARMAEIGDSDDIRDWIGCLVWPTVDHLTKVGSPTWFARFAAQVMTHPTLRSIMIEESQSSPSLVRIIESLHRCLPDLPAEVQAERGDMASQLLVHTIAERERALAENAPTPRSSWHDAAAGLIDGLVGLWTAPVTHRTNESDHEDHR